MEERSPEKWGIREERLRYHRCAMPNEFRQTSLALLGDQARERRGLVWIAVVAVLLVQMGLWLALARVPLYAVSAAARLQVCDEIHPVDVLVPGRVTTVSLPVGGQVRAEDVLVTLDATDITLRLNEARALEHGLIGQIRALETEIAMREEAIASTRVLGEASASEMLASRNEIEAEVILVSRERERVERLLQAGMVAEAEADRATTVAVQAKAAVSMRDHRIAVINAETRRSLADRRAQNESLRRELAKLTAERVSAAVLVKLLEEESARYMVRAPIDGLLGQVRAPQVGSKVTAGQTVAVVTPETALEIAADFAPADVIGRVHLGQRARMRVTGFPWAQYGMLEATVTAVSSEVLDGRIRVELALDGQLDSVIPRRHGLIGDVEIELEQVSPAALIARSVGFFERGEPL